MPPIEPVDLTPELAAWLLENPHPRQRIMRERHVDEIAAEMRSGRWPDYLPQPILVDAVTQTMFDGRHRCQAVVRTGMTMKAYIDWRSDAEVFFDKLDVGLRRTSAQFISEANASWRASVARISLWYRKAFDQPLRTQHLTWSLRAVLDETQRLDSFLSDAYSSCMTMYRVTTLSKAVCGGVGTLAFEEGVGGEWVQFASLVDQPFELPPDHVARALHVRMTRLSNRNRRRDEQADWIILVNCFNAFLKDQKMSRVQVGSIVPRIATGKRKGKAA